jgi:hypothetical protein
MESRAEQPAAKMKRDLAALQAVASLSLNNIPISGIISLKICIRR